ncbi:hypothetical protein Q9189_007086 [Teloschistes chrysophthalmus]
MVVSFAIKSWIEGGVISAVVILNIVVGFFQEFQAEKTMDSLRSLSSPTANAIRDGRNITVPTAEVVLGDLVEMKTGDTIPADVRLIEAVNFEADETLLTGESLPVRKDAEVVLDEELTAGDRINVAFSSSTVTRGRAQGVVFATGMCTEIGAIAAALRKKGSKMRTVKRKEDGTAKPHRYLEAWTITGTDAVGRFLGVNVGTLLQKKLSRLAILLLCIAVVCALIVLGANCFSSQQEVIIYAVATGLSMIPASLIVVLTITMAAGTKRMVERHVIVRNLNSLEALGAVTDICSDKTGTLTQGKMVVRKAWIPSKGTYSLDPSTEPFNPTAGTISFEDSAPRNAQTKNAGEKGGSDTPADLLDGYSALEDYLKVASVHMLTGDHPGTARAIALDVGILPKRMHELNGDVSDAMVMTASQFVKLSEPEVDALPVLPLVVARCTPDTKVRMIEALHRRRKFAAMTGDGVNDSPSLKRADVGIAMGQGGSDVAKDASDIILTDDNFASILNAIEEGRRIFDNIQKFVLHLLAENIAQASTLLVGLAFKDESSISVFPLSPVEILWVIMITSGMPDMGLGFETAAPDIMQRPPQSVSLSAPSINQDESN